MEYYKEVTQDTQHFDCTIFLPSSGERHFSPKIYTYKIVSWCTNRYWKKSQTSWLLHKYNLPKHKIGIKTIYSIFNTEDIMPQIYNIECESPPNSLQSPPNSLQLKCAFTT